MVDRVRDVRRWAGFIVLALIAIGVVLGVVSVSGRTDAYRPLVGKEDWRVSGAFKSYEINLDPTRVPDELARADEYRLWLAWSANPKDLFGEVTSGLFRAPSYIAVPYAGFPDEVPGNRIVLRCEVGGSELPVSRFRMNEQWATSYLAIPEDFCRGLVRLVASVAGVKFIGVGTPYEISAASYYAQVGIFPRALVVLVTWSMALLTMVIFAFAFSRLVPTVDEFGAGLVGFGASGMIALSLYSISGSTGRVGVYSMVAIGAAASAFILIRERDWLGRIAKQWRDPLIVWLSVALLYAAVVTVADNGGGSWWINGLFTPLRWSSDNQIPYTLAEDIYQGRVLANINWGPWLATDRTPLLSGLLLPVRLLFITPISKIFGSTFVPTAYMMACITILAAWVAVVFRILSEARPAVRCRSMILLAVTPFLFFNSVYAWPKLLGATYALLAFGLLLDLTREKRVDAITLPLVAGAAMLSVLSHASNAFAMLAIAIWFAPTILRQRPITILVGCMLAGVLALPWLYWQVYIQPGGNALMRFALALDDDVDNRGRSVLSAMRDIYSQMSFRDWAHGKLSSLALMTGLEPPSFGIGDMAQNSPGAGAIGNARVNDFFSVGHSMALTFLGLFAVPLMKFYRRADPSVTSLAIHTLLCGLLGVGLTVLITLPPAIVHHQAYGALLLLCLSGALAIASAPTLIAWILTATQSAYFLVVWVGHPISIANVVHPSAIYLIIVVIAATGWLMFDDSARRREPEMQRDLTV